MERGQVQTFAFGDGIIISTIFALLTVSYPWLILNINKRLFKINIRKYFLRVVAYTIITAADVAITYFICSHIALENVWLTLGFRLLVCVAVSSLNFVVAFWKTDETKYMFQIARKLMKRKE